MNDSDFLIKLGARIVVLRKKKGMNQSDLSDRMGIEESALSRIENGKVNSTINMLRNVAESLEMNLLELLEF